MISMIINKFYSYKGKRIRASDKNLLFRYFGTILIPIFLLVIILLYIKDILIFNWNEFILSEIDLSIPYLIISMIIAAIACIGVSCLYYYKRFDFIKQLQHRQKLAKMILENHWYESEQIQSQSFFKDLGNKNKEKILHFPKLYYMLKNGYIHIQVEIRMSSYQEQLLQLEKKLETGLYCELKDKILKDSYVEYILLYDTIGNRISIDEVVAENGKLKLMESLYWEYDQLPHMLIAGGTGGGKTYFILTIIKALLKTNSKLYILDPKNSDLADLETVMNDVYYKKDDMINCLNQFYEAMLKRSEEMKKHPNYKTGENYAYLGLSTNFLIFDEYIAFMDMIGRQSLEVMNKLKQIVMLGRQAGFFLILACQRPDAKYLGDGIRDQFNIRIALGRMSELGYGMMFGDTNKQFFIKPIKGRGYIDTGVNVISEFYTPLVSKGYDFLKEIAELTKPQKEEKVMITKKEDE